MRIFLLIFFFAQISCNNENEGTPLPEYQSETLQYKTIISVDENLMSLDVHFPKDVLTKKPVIFYVHGGGWSIGDKSQQLDNKINFCREEGYILVSVNYRLSPFPFDIEDTDRVMFPIHNVDIAAALKWVVDNIAGFGGDKDKIAIMGHSAGAHLVALMGTRDTYVDLVGLSLDDIKGVAVIDTKGYDVREQVINGTNQNMYINAFGTDSLQNVAASPIFNVKNNKAYPKFFIAKRGEAQRIAAADVFIDKLETNGVEVTQVNGSAYDHNGINKAIGKADETVITLPLKQFFKDCFE